MEKRDGNNHCNANMSCTYVELELYRIVANNNNKSAFHIFVFSTSRRAVTMITAMSMATDAHHGMRTCRISGDITVVQN